LVNLFAFEFTPSSKVIWLINSKRMRQKVCVVLLRKKINTYSFGVLVRNPDVKGPLGRSECVREDSI
jgi:hypothetical protein